MGIVKSQDKIHQVVDPCNHQRGFSKRFFIIKISETVAYLVPKMSKEELEAEATDDAENTTLEKFGIHNQLENNHQC